MDSNQNQEIVNIDDKNDPLPIGEGILRFFAFSEI